MLTNDLVSLTPITTFDGPALDFDFAGLEIGVAEYAEGPTGCTVFHFPAGAMTTVDVRGGYPATIYNWEWNNALCLSGGSLYGLEAVAGVIAELWAHRSYTTDWGQFVLASGAAVYDFHDGRNKVYPDKALGRAAVRALQPGRFLLGARGAGRSTQCGWPSEPAGQGGAFRQVGATKVAVFSVVNSTGCVVNRAGQVVRGNLDAATGRRESSLARLETRLAAGDSETPAPGNTTLTVLITNQVLDRQNLTQLGRQVHASMARAIQPFHALGDGDVLYAVTTAAVENPTLATEDLGLLAGELAWDAVLRAVGAEPGL